jgi:E3 ubiquitin-protein ligase DOA10
MQLKAGKPMARRVALLLKTLALLLYTATRLVVRETMWCLAVVAGWYHLWFIDRYGDKSVVARWLRK